ncbi:uncharacterized protein N7469_009055 [Penicillium citrinum]|uniref:Endonuclease n=2 Tax=Penicillium TaxID=5073 RepID=A0A9W9TIS0_PENCI|nr:uncharacterized protein N7469_009055 [Penicillium citrinum]KAJ5222815.1 hypothetical protein N7469_009055 [Penicillium citrinum]KAJ5580976.1 hypothetical protein N7450_007277 [Penicillium hetheringtonii]
MSKTRSIAAAAVGGMVGAGLSQLYPGPSKDSAPNTFPIQSKSLPSPSLIILPSKLDNGSAQGKNTLVSKLVEPSGVLKYGNPGPVNDELKESSLYGAYDRRTRNPSWVAEHMTRESVSAVSGERRNNFRQDTSIPVNFRAKVSDYSNTEYDRGHQVPANPARWSQEAVDGTFKMSNMCPQIGVGFNRHYWAYFEDFCKNLTNRYPSVRVITGPLYLPHRGEDGKWRVSYEVIGQEKSTGSPPNVAVPTHFYKIIFGEEDNDKEQVGKKVAVGAFVLPNAVIKNDKDLTDFEVELDVIERASGLEFAQDLKSSHRRRLCEEIKCDIKVKDFNDAIEEVTDLAAEAKL